MDIILSASGWRGVFAKDGNEESGGTEMNESCAELTVAAAAVFADFLRDRRSGRKGPISVILGMDTRPTSASAASLVLNVLTKKRLKTLVCGIAAVTDIMAYAKACGEKGRADGFIYITASHNPIGYNGIKFGLTDGGVLGGADMALLAEKLTAMSPQDKACLVAENSGLPAGGRITNATMTEYQGNMKAASMDFTRNTVSGGNSSVMDALKDGICEDPLGIAVDFNGSARAYSVDWMLYALLGLKFDMINEGGIVHQIVPEGEALTPCCLFLDDLRKNDAAFALGYVPDCDGDRGNIVFFDDKAGHSRPVEAQDVLALTCLAELCQLVWTGALTFDKNDGKAESRVAIAVNDATSMRIDRIAEAFGAKTFRAETGEANVVQLGRRLRAEGWICPVMGEGAAGGSIVHPSAVRNPLLTVASLFKLLRIRGGAGKKGFFEIWRERSGGADTGAFTIADVIASLPAFTTTSAYSPESRLQIRSADHSALKGRYQQVFLRDWEDKKKHLRDKHGIVRWEAAAYNGSTERRGIGDFAEAGKGGLRIYFYNETGAECASLWMRGSGTEPVFRVMADVAGADVGFERELLEWQRDMVTEADGTVQQWRGTPPNNN
jgi:phosphoglucomutase